VIWYLPTVAVAVVVGVAALWGVWWLWWRLPKRQVERLSLKIRDPKARADVEDNFRKTIGQLIGGAAVLVGAGLAYLQFSQQQQASQQQFSQQQQASQRQFSQQQQASRDLLISNQVSKGFEQLGKKESVVVRLGGIYALEGVMNASAQYHTPVLEALCAFVRDGTQNETGEGPPASDFQAALTVIGRRQSWTNGDVDLHGANLSGVSLGELNLIGVNLSGAYLVFANLRDASLDGANLSHATLLNSNLSMATLSRANLSGANIGGLEPSRADLSRADLDHADLSGANLSRTNLSGANMRHANISGTVFDGACGVVEGLDLRLPPCK
jgi:uncharacterized protein YjbI with pentapeptide repeats